MSAMDMGFAYNTVADSGAYSRLMSLRADKRDRARHLLGNLCVHCGSTELLEFDHIDWRTKDQHSHNAKVSRTSEGRGNRRLWDRSWNYIESVLPEYQLLCRDCHREKSRQDRYERCGQRPYWEHGTITGYFAKHCRCRPCTIVATRYTRRRETIRYWKHIWKSLTV